MAVCGATLGAVVLDDTHRGPGLSDPLSSIGQRDPLGPVPAGASDAVRLLFERARSEIESPFPVRVDPAVRSVRKEASEDEPGGLLALGLLYYHGISLPHDAARAQDLFARARQRGNRRAVIALAWCLLEGCAGPRDVEGAGRLLPEVRRADAGRADYFEYLSLAQLQGATPDDLARAGRALARAVQAGDPYAMNERALALVREGRHPAALEMLRRAASEGSRVAGRNAERVAHLQARQAQPAGAQAAEGSGADALFAQGQRFHRGDGVPADYAMAIRQYRAAAAAGSEPAKRMLALIFSRPAADGSLDATWMRQLANLDPSRPSSTLAPTLSLAFEAEPSAIFDLIPARFRHLLPPPR